jgi:uncharacterized protein
LHYLSLKKLLVMKWMGRKGSDHVEDRRGLGGKQIALGGGGLAIVVLVISLLTGKDLSQFLGPLNSGQPNTQQTQPTQSKESNELAQYSSVVLADCEQVWSKIFEAEGSTYPKPTMVLFSDATTSGCGNASSSIGPFYCPADDRIYLDVSFFGELTQRLGAHGDFALAYVIAHEVGHHIQNKLGTSGKMRKLQQGLSEADANKLSVALELQADFYAGVWAHHNQQLNQVLEEGDIEEALSAANAVGDDRLQKASTGQIMPDAFTHGTSEQRMFWFKKGWQTGNWKEGNTFKALLGITL